MSGRRNRINDEDEVESRQNDHKLHFRDIKRQIFSVIVSNVCSTRRVLTVSHVSTESFLEFHLVVCRLRRESERTQNERKHNEKNTLTQLVRTTDTFTFLCD